jgi:Zn-dependent protease with chaperone function
MEQEQHMVAYTSKINPEFNVFVVYKEYEGYKTIKDSLEKMNNSIGALWVGTKNIFIDGEAITDDNIDQDHLLAIEAHEIAHSMLSHDAGVDEQSEKEADLFGIALLEMSGMQRAASILKERMLELYNIDYTKFEEEFENDENFQD